ncbi:MAG: FAD-dependent monooxygenase [Pirellulales bacterium]
MAATSADVLIIGAGPVGLTLAAALHHQGLSVRIIDKAPEPSDKSKALVVWSRTLELLHQLGLADRFIDSGLKIRGATIHHQNQRLVHIEIAGIDTPYPFPLMIPQNVTEQLLTEHLAANGITVERRVELVSFTANDDAVTATLRHPEVSEEIVTTPWLVGCDGAHSTVRHTLDLEFTGEAEPNDWILADVHIDGPLATDEISVYWHSDGVIVFFPIQPGRFRMVADIGAAKQDVLPPTPTLAEAQAKADERGPAGLTLSDPIWLANFRINERKVSDYRVGRVMLAGDAAHIHSPAGGQGMNTGMQDAFNLAWKLALAHRGQGQVEPLLASYSVERSAIGDQVLHGAETLTTVATLRNPAAQFIRNHVAPVITSFGFVQDKIKNTMCELSINYRHSPLSKEDWPRLGDGPEAGDRLPDLPLAGIEVGRATSLFAELRSGKHQLLLAPVENDKQSENDLLEIASVAEHAYPGLIAAHLVTDAAAREKLGASGAALYLVRPDGYVAYRTQSADVAALANYLGSYLVPTS